MPAEVLYNLESGSWLAWANDTAAHYAAIHFPHQVVILVQGKNNHRHQILQQTLCFFIESVGARFGWRIARQVGRCRADVPVFFSVSTPRRPMLMVRAAIMRDPPQKGYKWEGMEELILSRGGASLFFRLARWFIAGWPGRTDGRSMTTTNASGRSVTWRTTRIVGSDRRRSTLEK